MWSPHRRVATITVAALTVSMLGGYAAADPTPSPSDTTTALSDTNDNTTAMTRGLARLTDAVAIARSKRVAADKRYAVAAQRYNAATDAVAAQQGAVADARGIVGSYARAAYQSGPTDLTFIASMLDADSPQDLMRRADTVERVGDHKDAEYDAAQQILQSFQTRAAAAAQHRDDAAAAVQLAITAEAQAVAAVSDYTRQWADRLADTASGGGEQAAANSAAAQAWARWLNRPAAHGAPTVTLAQVRSGNGLPKRVTVKPDAPGVAWWKRKKKSRPVVVLPDRTASMVTYAVAKLGANYQWRRNTDTTMDCAALLDRAWNTPLGAASAADNDRPLVPGGVRGIARNARLLPVSSLAPGDVVLYRDGTHGVNHAGIAITDDTMIAADAASGGVNAVPIRSSRTWKVARLAAQSSAGARIPGPVSKKATWQCGIDPTVATAIAPSGQWIFPTASADWLEEKDNPSGTDPGMRVHPVLGYARCHDGWDIANSSGDPIYAVADGVATAAPFNGGAGNMLTIAHGTVNGATGVESVYMHLSGFAPGIDGTVVKRGQLVGYIGTTGLSSGPHLHFQVTANGSPVDPRHFFFPDVPLTPACSG